MNCRGSDSVIRFEGGHWKHSYHFHEYTGEGIAVVENIDDRSIQNGPRHMRKKTENCEKSQNSEETEKTLGGRCYDEIGANRQHYILHGNYFETSYRRRCLTARYDAARGYPFLVFPLDGPGENEAVDLD